MKIIVNIDDFGISRGVNQAVFDTYDAGCVNSCSIMANGLYFDCKSVENLISRSSLKKGVHLNISYGKSFSNNNQLIDNNGFFYLSFTKILLKSIYSNSFKLAIENEFKLQIEHIISQGLTISHIDSHRHIHTIPGLYKIVCGLADKYNIPRVRTINENFVDTYLLTKSLNFILNGGLLKFLLLKFFYKINKINDNKFSYNGYKFFSIIHTGHIKTEYIRQIINLNIEYEIATHPSYRSLDDHSTFYSKAEKKYHNSADRDNELMNLMNLKGNIE